MDIYQKRILKHKLMSLIELYDGLITPEQLKSELWILLIRENYERMEGIIQAVKQYKNENRIKKLIKYDTIK